MKELREALNKWFGKYKRDLPWRRTHDPYLIWLSEIILQQTRIEQGLPYYKKFVERFPDVFQLAEANEEEVLNLWQGLGYYNRARNMHHTAKVIATEYNGVFPESPEDLKKLKGIGDYTASAISSMAFDKPHAVVDGNVYRVLARIFGIREAVNTAQGKKVFKQKAETLLDRNQPGTFNEALMDFGAIQCKSASPKCAICPVQQYCYAFHHNEVEKLPLKSKRVKKKTRYFHYVVMCDTYGLLLRKRGDEDIWRNMFDFPLWEAKNGEVINKSDLADWLNLPFKRLVYKKQLDHVLTHQNIKAYFYYSDGIFSAKKNKNFIFVPWAQLENYPLPRLIERFIDNFFD